MGGGGGSGVVWGAVFWSYDRDCLHSRDIYDQLLMMTVYSDC